MHVIKNDPNTKHIFSEKMNSQKSKIKNHKKNIINKNHNNN